MEIFAKPKRRSEIIPHVNVKFKVNLNPNPGKSVNNISLETGWTPNSQTHEGLKFGKGQNGE